MYSLVFITHEIGRPIVQERVQAQIPKRGLLTVEPAMRRSRPRRLIATLQDQLLEDLLPMLVDVSFVRLNVRGMLIEGTEIIERGKNSELRYPQRWICKFMIDTVPAWTVHHTPRGRFQDRRIDRPPEDTPTYDGKWPWIGKPEAEQSKK